MIDCDTTGRGSGRSAEPRPGDPHRTTETSGGGR
jgi:hypothetical protein